MERNTIQGKDFTIENITPQLATLYPKNQNVEYNGFDTNYLILDFGEKVVGDNTTCNFIFRSDKYKIISSGSSCGCTNPSFQDTEEANKQHVTIKFDSSKITKNVSKVFTLYITGNHKLEFNLIINKP
jgi:hypothetical protein